MTRLRDALPAVNAFACLLFVLLREPYTGISRDAWEAEHRAPGVFLNSNDFALPSVACRPLYSWSKWHGGESLGVKILETANTVPVAIAAVVHGIGVAGPAKRISACAWSLIVAAVLLACATVQWSAVGAVVDWRFTTGC